MYFHGIDRNNSDNIYNNNQQDLIPKFKYMPEFLKIFELKKINFLEDKIISKKYPEYEINVFYPRQFQALRTLYFSENFENFIFSIKDSENWELTGGKSKAKFYRKDHPEFDADNLKPDNLKEMIEVSKKLSKDIPFVRVDLYNINNHIYFSELTFSPGGGYGMFYPEEYEILIGNYIKLDK